MELTALPVVIAAAVAAAVCVGAVPWTWDRWSRPRTARLARTALVLLATTSVLLAGSAYVNRQAGFFPTVQSLVTGKGAIVTVGKDGVVEAVSTRTTPLVDLQRADLRRAPGHGAVLGLPIGGGRTGLTRTGAVYLPAAYFDPTQSRVRFPVLEVLSGSPGNPAQTLHLLRLAEALDKAIADHQMAPTVVVVPDTNGSPIRDRECVDAARGTQDDTYLTKDVQAWTTSHFRVFAPGAGWALLGTSTGGYCAVNLSLRHPDRYAAAASLSGYFHALTDVTTGALFDRPQQRLDNDPTWRVQHLPATPVALWLSAGTAEMGELRGLRSFAAVLPRGSDVTTLVVPKAGHAFVAWRAVLPQALAWASSRLTPPAAPPPGVAGQQVVRPSTVRP